jgi:hypothetical protein
MVLAEADSCSFSASVTEVRDLTEATSSSIDVSCCSDGLTYSYRNYVDISCIDCGNKKGQKRVDTDLTKPVEVSHFIWNEEREELLDEDSIEIVDVRAMTHNLKDVYNDETLLSSEQMFDELEELKFKILDKDISLEAGDYSECPKKYVKKTKSLVKEFHDRFSKRKLDIEVTDIYEAELNTHLGRKLTRKLELYRHINSILH